jgi:hypothetical protein
LSHLRWVWVWQRPQHLVARLARRRRTWFVEEPVAVDVPQPRLCVERHGAVRRVWLEVPGDADRLDFDDQRVAELGPALREVVGEGPEVAWLYTPLALPVARSLRPRAKVYDVMDDLAAFAGAPRRLRELQRAALGESDVVFAGGRSLHRGVAEVAGERAHCFPSGVEPEHYAPARTRRAPRERPVAGYVGVIDERVDLGLVAELARRLPDWDLELVGPVAKIDPAQLPVAENLRYSGLAPYERLPDVMAGFDVGLMPFALNEATLSISPTKTLEYLAAGLPVVSTPVPDVVADYGGVVTIERDAAGFQAACRALRRDGAALSAQAEPLLRLHHWDAIAARMEALVDAHLSRPADAAKAAAVA